MEMDIAGMLWGAAALAVTPHAVVAGSEALWRKAAVRHLVSRYFRVPVL